VDVVVTPVVAATERRALLVALERAGLRRAGTSPRELTWWRAGLRDAVEGEDADASYAFSPRSTRGATRA
jgi:hypothetical protein